MFMIKIQFNPFEKINYVWSHMFLEKSRNIVVHSCKMKL